MVFSVPAQAASEFATSYRIDYTVEPNGLVAVDQQINLTNRLANIYATEYSVTIGSTELTQIRAWDQSGALETQVEIQANRTEIRFSFPDKVVGKGEGRQFHLTYQSPDFAQIKGRVLEIGIPLLADIQELNDYQVILHVPAVFDKANYFLPTPHAVGSDAKYRHYTFTKDNVDGFEGITGTFGEYQLFTFSLRYHLENPNSRQATTQIALPADTPFQQVAYTNWQPAPNAVETDPDGNWLATYTLDGKQRLEVTAQGVAKIFLTPQPELRQSLDQTAQAKYLVQQTYWPVDDPEIKALAQRLKTPEAIYTFLVRNFQYDYDRLTVTAERKGAAWALAHPNQLICMEFTDLFVTLARAAGIPAREVNGFAYTTNSKLRPLSLEQDVLHAWPEYYDETAQVWIPVDPTWGNTTGGLDFFHKLDLDHFAFVRHGLDSSQPLSAGAYKLADTNGKDVQIGFAPDFPEAGNPEARLDFPASRLAGLPIAGQVTITNPGPRAISGQTGTLTVTRDNQTLLTQPFDLGQLPPNGSQRVPLRLETNLFDRSGTYDVTVSLGDLSRSAQIRVRPFVASPVTWGVGGLLVLLMLVLGLRIRRKRS